MFWRKWFTQEVAVVQEKAPSQWKELSKDVHVYARGDDGKIIGKVKSYGTSTWWAEIRCTDLGNYITLETAKAAVEKVA